jgi:ABC-2 type transport system ATP-binding protein
MRLEIQGLTKSYRRGTRVNDGISLSAAEGEVFGLLGHNGAGKTTLVNQVIGLLRPDVGSIRIDGRDVVADPGFARRACSIQPQATLPISGLTPDQAVELIGRLRGGSATVVRHRRDALFEALDVGEWRGADGEHLSGGVKRLVSFCMAAVTPGRVVILDEPTNDVDPVRRRLLWDKVRAVAAEGSTILLVTHNVVEAERAVDRLAILDHGRLLVEGTPAQLKSRVADDLRLELVIEPEAPFPALEPWVVRSVAIGQRIVAAIPSRAAATAVAWAEAQRLAGRIEEFALAPATLEDVYVDLVGRADAVAGGHDAIEIGANLGRAALGG